MKNMHISPTLKTLHWLPIKQRISFKIASLTFKTLLFKEPAYLLDHLKPYNPSCSLRSSTDNRLSIPFIKSSQCRRSFAYAAPTIWNSLPLSLRMSSSISTFHAGLKTHFFPP